jgi:hypothetical protein
MIIYQIMDMKDQGEINVLQRADQEVITDGNKDTYIYTVSPEECARLRENVP